MQMKIVLRSMSIDAFNLTTTFSSRYFTALRDEMKWRETFDNGYIEVLLQFLRRNYNSGYLNHMSFFWYSLHSLVYEKNEPKHYTGITQSVRDTCINRRNLIYSFSTSSFRWGKKWHGYRHFSQMCSSLGLVRHCLSDGNFNSRQTVYGKTTSQI